MKLQQRIVWALAGAMIAVAANCVSTAPVAAQDDSNLLCRLGVNVFHQRPATFDLPALRAGWYVDGLSLIHISEPTRPY